MPVLRTITLLFVPLVVLLVGGAEALALPKKNPMSARHRSLTHPRQADRRAVLSTVLATMIIQPRMAHAAGECEQRIVWKQAPTAPMGALLPSIQQRLLLEACLELAKQNDLKQLQTILMPLDETTNNSASNNAKLLRKYNPARVLRGDLVRATMNLYQTNLDYRQIMNNPSDSFTVTDPAWQKAYIRANDGLPDLDKIIGADLDLRQLLRNQVQVKLDDAAAELYLQDCDVAELTALLQDAARNFDLWLDRIQTSDVREALQAAREGQSVQVYASYVAGFLPPPARER